MKETMKVSVLGQGLGYSLANLLASKGHKTIGLDIRKEAFANPLVDNHMAKFIARNKKAITKNIHYTTDYSDINDSDVVLCFVETPLLPSGHLGIESVRRATKSALDVISQDCTYVMMSTLPVNGSHQLFQEFGDRLRSRYVYVPPMIQKVDFLKNYLQPPYLLFGYDQQKVGKDRILKLKKFYNGIIRNSPPMWFTEPLNVEIAKLATNAFASMKGVFFNRLAEYTQNLGANADLVCSMVGSHRIVRKEYARPGGAILGPCLPRDVKELYSSADGKFSELLRKLEECNTPFIKVEE
jgi:nucleotide sugar dehydrogenase